MKLSAKICVWELSEPFVISRGAQKCAETIQVTVTDTDGREGRGEGCPVDYRGETAESLLSEVEKCGPRFEMATDLDPTSFMQPGGARQALDAALWDLRAQREGKSVFELAGLGAPQPLETAMTIGIRAPEEYEIAARSYSEHRILKLKVGKTNVLSAIRAARRGAPHSVFIVDPNQAWDVSQLKCNADELSSLGVVLLEQPIPVGDEGELDGYECPIPLCADELVNTPDDLVKAKDRFQAINIKLDKAGGLSSALELADKARGAGFKIMVGCFTGSSLSIAPAMVLGQRCDFVDLDGPLFLKSDRPGGLNYSKGFVDIPRGQFWGGSISVRQDI